MSFLQLENRNIVLMGVANRRSVAWAIAQVLRENGANLLYVFKDEELLEKNRSLIGADAKAIVCDVENEADIRLFGSRVQDVFPVVHGYVHSIAFANYSEGVKPFHETLRKDFLQAVEISCFSLVETTNQLKELLSEDASIVTISISTTKMDGWRGPGTVRWSISRPCTISIGLPDRMPGYWKSEQGQAGTLSHWHGKA